MGASVVDYDEGADDETAKGPLESLLHSLLMKRKSKVEDDSTGYIMLMQHTLDLSHRLVGAGSSATGETSAGAAARGSHEWYRRAGMRTPTESAVRDMAGGWLLQRIVSLSSQNSWVWVQTAQCIELPSHLHTSPTITIDLSSDPMGWDEGEANVGTTDESSTLVGKNTVLKGRLTDLEQTACLIEEATKRVIDGTIGDDELNPVLVVLESLTPLIAVHGFDAIVLLLQRLKNNRQIVLVVPVLVETLTQTQHMALEDVVANAVLKLADGELHLIRRGSGGKLVQVHPQFELTNLTMTLLSSSDSLVTEKPAEPSGAANETSELESRTKELSLTSTAVVGNASKTAISSVSLSLSDGARDKQQQPPPPSSRQASKTQPNIYIQDDDPEFDDMDEEDPDDDLDI
eukprot:scaffold131595_cov53-Attheya_sp.AAC.11